MLQAVFCWCRQRLRRSSWLLLVLAGLFAYPAQVAWQVSRATHEALLSAAPHITSARQLAEVAAQAAAVEQAQVVSPTYLFSKLTIAVTVFCLIMGLAWGSLNMVMAVMSDWATGRYTKPKHYAAVGLDGPVLGFKRTFLTQSGLARICLFLGTLTLLILAAGLGVWAAFTIQ